MPFNTAVTALLGCRHPILLAPMDLVAGARLTAAVSIAGGFGILGGGYGDRDWLTREIDALIPLVGNSGDASLPFGIGFITWSLARQPELLELALEARPRAIMLSFGDPRPFAPRIKSAGAVLICQVQNEDMASEALEAGADLLVAQGTEAGGHGATRSTLDIVPAIVDLAAGRVAVVAAGGLADGRGLVASLAWGAVGVLLSSLKQVFQQDDEFWTPCAARWGQGPGFRSDIASRIEGWFKNHPRVSSRLEEHLQGVWEDNFVSWLRSYMVKA